MFTGLVKELGIVRQISGLGKLYRLSIEAKDISNDAAIGDSVAVNGVCLTLTGKDKNTLSFDVMGETVRQSNISKLKHGDPVNLETALKIGEKLGGHFVTGHIDCVGRIKDIKRGADDVSIGVVFPEEYNNLVVEKGSIALDGISLTIGSPSGEAAGKTCSNAVTVYIIPHTLKMTTLGSKRAGDEVNIEFDIIGKYLAKYNNKFEKGQVS